MSVKDKIAMWNSMATPSNNNHLNSQTTSSEHLHKPKEQEADKKQEIPHQNQEHKAPPKVEQAEETKKIVTNEHPSSVKVEIQSYPLRHTQNPKQVSAKEEVPNPQPTQEVQSGVGLSFKEIMKLMENQTAGKGLMGFAPQAPVVPIIRVKSETIEKSGERAECEIEKDVPVVSVKERAAQLALFYEKKRKQSQNQPNPAVEQKKEQPEEHKQPKEVEPTKAEQTKPEQNNSLNISAPQHEGSNTIIESTSTQNIPPTPTTQDPSLSLRFQNRTKKAKQKFESDDD